MAATVAAYQSIGATEATTRTSIDSVGGTAPKFNREDTVAGTPPIPIPTATGTNYSYPKWCYLWVTTGDSTSLSNRTIHQASTPTTGLYMFWRTDATYAQAAAAPTAGAANGEVPATYTAMTNSAVSYHAASAAGTTGERNGQFLVLLFGVGFNYAGGAGAATALPALTLSYDEA